MSVASSVFLALSAGGVRRAGGHGRADGPEPQGLAKLYGYIRYFHPSDEAARVDWDALAIYAAGKVKDAADPGRAQGRPRGDLPARRPVHDTPPRGRGLAGPGPAAASPSDAS